MDGGARSEGSVKIEHRQVEGQRRMIGEPVVRAGLEFARRPVDEGTGIAMADAHAFRHARRARGIEDVCQLVRRCGAGCRRRPRDRRGGKIKPANGSGNIVVKPRDPVAGSADHLCGAVLGDRYDPARRCRAVQRYVGRAYSEHSLHRGDDRRRLVVPHDDPVTAPGSEFGKPACEAIGRAVQLAVAEGPFRADHGDAFWMQRRRAGEEIGEIHSPASRAMISRWISDVPENRVLGMQSRRYRSTPPATRYPAPPKT